MTKVKYGMKAVKVKAKRSKLLKLTLIMLIMVAVSASVSMLCTYAVLQSHNTILNDANLSKTLLIQDYNQEKVIVNEYIKGE